MQEVITAIEQWLHECVIGLSLCPYAKAPITAGEVRIVCCEKKRLKKPAGAAGKKNTRLTEADFTDTLELEIQALLESSDIETTLVVGAGLFAEFLDFNDYMGDIEEQLASQGIDDYLQLAGFHPGYHFAGEDISDAGNYTNRAPYPIIQLLRVDSVAAAVESGETLEIPKRNVKRLRSLERAELQRLFPWVSGGIEPG